MEEKFCPARTNVAEGEVGRKIIAKSSSNKTARKEEIKSENMI